MMHCNSIFAYTKALRNMFAKVYVWLEVKKYKVCMEKTHEKFSVVDKTALSSYLNF